MFFLIKNKNNSLDCTHSLYNLQYHPTFLACGTIGQIRKKRRALCWSIILLVYGSMECSYGLCVHCDPGSGGAGWRSCCCACWSCHHQPRDVELVQPVWLDSPFRQFFHFTAVKKIKSIPTFIIIY